MPTLLNPGFPRCRLLKTYHAPFQRGRQGLRGPERALRLRRAAFSDLRPAFGLRLSGSRWIMDAPRLLSCNRKLLSVFMVLRQSQHEGRAARPR
jgi:hypothetical protein